ncbi:MAG: tRNA (adenosine(37)-N6)-threonylcarbamoyltransferase complex dimerization subunit type 1 TsaB [Acidobacteriaceae bacterium]
MLVLLVDTAGVTGCVLLAAVHPAADGTEAVEVLGRRDLRSREISERLIAAMSELLGNNSRQLMDVEFFAVVSGPGAFTGLRVGLSAVKALAEATAKPIVAVSRLAVMASSVVEQDLVHCVLDAGRGELYHGMYRDQGWTCLAESLQTRESLSASLKALPGRLVASDPAVMSTLEALGPVQLASDDAPAALALALRHWHAGRLSDAAALDANYVRRSDEEILLKLASRRGQQRAPSAEVASAGSDSL